MDYLNYPFYIFFGVLPSLIWLAFYLRKDAHPEPKLMILRIFLYGLLATLPAFFLELAILKEIGKLNLSDFLVMLLSVFLGAALIEESLKFLVVKEKVLNNPEFDEPVDAMIYMIIAALGFAAGENILIIFSQKTLLLTEVFKISVLRFIGATFLHTLASGTIGFFIGLSFFKKEKRVKFMSLGLILAIFFHGLYNFLITTPLLMSGPGGSIIKTGENFKVLSALILLFFMAVFVSLGFKKLKKLKT